jgi:hypothetical protein
MMIIHHAVCILVFVAMLMKIKGGYYLILGLALA